MGAKANPRSQCASGGREHRARSVCCTRAPHGGRLRRWRQLPGGGVRTGDGHQAERARSSPDTERAMSVAGGEGASGQPAGRLGEGSGRARAGAPRPASLPPRPGSFLCRPRLSLGAEELLKCTMRPNRLSYKYRDRYHSNGGSEMKHIILQRAEPTLNLPGGGSFLFPSPAHTDGPGLARSRPAARTRRF